MKKILLHLIFYLFCSSLWAQSETILLHTKQELNLNPQVIAYEDSMRSLSFEQVLKLPIQNFRKASELPKKMNSQSVFWIQLNAQNATSITEWALKIDAELDWIDIYLLDSNRVLLDSAKTGFLCPFSQKSIPVVGIELAKLNLPIGQKTSIWVRIQNKSHLPIQWDIKIEPYHQWQQNYYKSYLPEKAFHLLVQGMFWILILYNFCIFLINRQIVYAYYALYMLGVTLFSAQSAGLLGNYVIGEIPILNYYARSIGLYAGFIFHIPFIFEFLNLKKTIPSWHRALKWIWVMWIILFITSLIIITAWYQLALYKRISGLAVIGGYLSYAIFCLFLFFKRKNFILGRYIAIGTLSLSIGALMAVMSFFLEIKINPFIFTEIGTVFEILVFSLGLGYRMKLNEEEKLAAQIQNQKILEEQYHILEEKVKERTVEIQQAKEEIEAQAEELQSSNQALQVANYEIQKHNEDVRSSINAAFRIQTAMLPLQERIDGALGKENYFMLYKPRDVVSGDFYYFEQLDNQIVIAVADCTGHGVPGAFMSMIGINFLEDIIRNQKITQSSLILYSLNQNIRQALKQDQHQTREGMDMNLICIDQTQKTVQYAGAMNPFYYIENQEFKEIKATKKPIGGMQAEEDRQYENHIISFAEHPLTLYLCTDGYQDQFGGEKNKKFMVGAFKKLLFSIHEKPMSEQCQILDKTIENWREQGKEPQIDDITVMGLRIGKS